MDNILKEIAAKLADAGMDEAHVSASVTALKDAYAQVPEEELPEKLARSGGTDGIVAQILKTYENVKTDGAEPEPAETPAIEPADDQTDGPAADASEKEELSIISLDDDMFSDEADAVSAKNEEDVEGVIETIENSAPAQSSAEDFFDDDVKVKQPDGKQRPAKKSDTQSHQKSAKKPDKNKKSVKNMSSKAKTTYFVGLVFLIPLLIAVVIVITVLLLALYAGLIVLVVAFSIALVVVAAAGTALSLMAIIYGVIQIAQGFPAPIGIYEIGLGIIVGGATLGISIILYNFIVRLAPFLFKKLFVLYKFLFRQLTKLLSFVKGACSKL